MSFSFECQPYARTPTSTLEIWRFGLFHLNKKHSQNTEPQAISRVVKWAQAVIESCTTDECQFNSALNAAIDNIIPIRSNNKPHVSVNSIFMFGHVTPDYMKTTSK